MQFNPKFLTRQLDLIPLENLGQKITIIGAGAIGSHTALALARMGFGNLEIWDYDVVSEENMNNQGYYIDQIGTSKVEALASMIKRAMGFDVKVVNDIYTGNQETLAGSIVIAAVDSMTARKIIWKAVKESTATMFIDPRMGAESALLYVRRPDEVKSYEATLYTDDQAVRESCTAKSTIYCANLLSGIVVKAVKDIVLGENYTRTVEWSIKDNGIIIYKKDD